MFSSSRHKREQNGCFEEKKKCSLLTRTSIILRHIKNTFAQGWSLSLIHPFIQHVFVESTFWVRIYPGLLNLPITRQTKSSCLLGAYFLIQGDRQETCKYVTSYSDEYHEENKWARECLGKGAASQLSGNAFPR